MRLHASQHVAGVSPQHALAWWSDFREGRTDHGWLPGERRRILERRDGAVTMEDRFLLFRERTTATAEPGLVRFRGTNSVSEFEGTYRFEPADGGTRIVLDAEVSLRKGLRWSEAVARPVAQRLVEADLRGHARDLARELRRA